jgi:MFS family permease
MSKTAGRARGSVRPAMRVLLILLAGQAMASMDGSILAVAAPSLRADLGASDAQLQLVVAAYVLAFGALVVTGARLGDLLTPRRAFLLGLAAFTGASLLAGLAPTPAALIVARALQGGAGAVMTPQVLSLIQTGFAGEARARAIGAYSVVLAGGVAAGQVLGGLIVGAGLLQAAWRPALLLNAPAGIVVLAAARRGLPTAEPGPPRRLDLPGATALAVAVLALVVPLTFGRDAGWPAWTWPCLGLSAAALAAFVARERRARDPLFDLTLLAVPGVAAGIVAVLLVMGVYAAFLLSLTFHLQDGLGFTPLRAGVTFAAYAAGFATASLTWPHVGAAWRARLPVLGPPVMAAALLAIGLLARGGGWPTAATTAVLFCAGAGHAAAFSPLAARLTTAIRPAQAADLSGLITAAALIGNVVGVAALGGLYLGAAADGGSAHALAAMTAAGAAVLVLDAAVARGALTDPKEPNRWPAFARRS